MSFCGLEWLVKLCRNLQALLQKAQTSEHRPGKVTVSVYGDFLQAR